MQRLLDSLENGTREEIWEAAKQLESMTTDTVLQLVSLLENAKEAHSRSAAAYVLGFGRYDSDLQGMSHFASNVGPCQAMSAMTKIRHFRTSGSRPL